MVMLRRYIRAAACPKDVVILLDVSGSMKGLRIEIAKATVQKILDTLTDDDFFNVIMVRIRVLVLESSRFTKPNRNRFWYGHHAFVSIRLHGCQTGFVTS